MYSPAARPPSSLAAPAKNRDWSTHRGVHVLGTGQRRAAEDLAGGRVDQVHGPAVGGGDVPAADHVGHRDLAVAAGHRWPPSRCAVTGAGRAPPTDPPAAIAAGPVAVRSWTAHGAR